MNNLEPANQTRLFELDNYILELIQLEKKNNLPNKILLSGQKGLGKSTLAYHFINYSLSKNEDFKYDINNFEINPKNSSFKTILNKSNINFSLIDINPEKKSIDINQIRDLISNLKKSSFNNKPRYILIDNIEFLNTNSINALLKILEEPSENVFFILINNNKHVLKTLLSRCINFKISIPNSKVLEITNNLLNGEISEFINKDLINYYSTPGNLFNLAKFSKIFKYDLKDLDLRKFLNLIIEKKLYKKDSPINYLIYDFIEFYFNKLNLSLSTNINDKYSYFLTMMSDIKKFNLDEESFFIEFEQKILNG